MADVNINKFRASVVRDGSKPASPGFIVSEGQDPVDPAGNGQNHLPVTIATAATGLSITDSQVLGGAGTVGQYIRGDGSLADFPQASGGGSSVSYYLNGSISQGTIGGVAYKELNKVPILGAGTQFSINANGYIASFLTDAGDPNLLEIPGGNWNFETYFSASSSGGTPTFYVELYKYDGTTFTLIASSSTSPELIAFGTNLNPYFSTLAVPTTTLALTDRLAVRFYVTHSGRTITMHTENNTLCQVVTTFTTGLTSLNGLTAQVQNLAVGTSGTDFNIASATATHTFNLPTASATNRGALSSADWTTFNNKQNALGYVPVPETRTITINGVSQDLSANRTYNVGTVTSVGLSSATSGVTIGSTPVTTSGTITLAIATASGSQNGLLSSTDWTTFNSKQNALTNPVTGTGTTNYLPKFTGSTTIGNSATQTDATGNLMVGSANAGNAGTINVSVGVAGTTAGGLQLWAASNQTHYLQFGDGTTGAQVYAGYLAYAHSTDSLLFGTNGADKMTLFSTGNLLVGTGSDNGARLQVNGISSFTGNVSIGTINSTERLEILGPDGSGAAVRWRMGGGRKSGYLYSDSAGVGIYDTNLNDAGIYLAGNIQMDFRVNGSQRMFINSSGNVGIGTTSPTGRFMLYQSSAGNVFQNIVSNQGGSTQVGINLSPSMTDGEVAANPAQASIYATDLNYGANIIFATKTTGAVSNSLTPRMTITSSGNVLIGTTTDNTFSRLQVLGSAWLGQNVNRGLYFADGGSYTSIVGLNQGVSSYNSIELRASGVDGQLFLHTSGNVLIGTTTNNSHKLRVNGDLYVDGIYKVPVNSYFICGSSGYRFNNTTDAFNNFVALDNGNATLRGTLTQNASDERLKNNIEIIPNAIDKIKQLRGVTFKWNQELYETSRTFDIGVIAQEVEQVLPNAVCLAPFDTNFDDNTSKSGQNYLTVYYEKLIPLLIEGIKELKQEIDTLKN